MFLLQCTSEREIGDLFTSDSQGMIVIDAVLYVDRPMPEIFISLSQVPDTHYDNELWGINDAEVIVYQGPSTYQYQSTGSLGKYLPPSGAPAILPETEYRILVQALGRKVQGTSITPSRLSLKRVGMLDKVSQEEIRFLNLGPNVQNSIIYSEGLIEARFDPIGVQGYQVVIFEKETGEETSSPPLEVQNGRLRLPWFAIGSSGQHEIELYALDQNMFDLLRSIPQENSGFEFGSLAGDNFDQPIFRLDGGIGLFGSASVDKFSFWVLPER